MGLISAFCLLSCRYSNWGKFHKYILLPTSLQAYLESNKLWQYDNLAAPIVGNLETKQYINKTSPISSFVLKTNAYCLN